MWLVSWMAACGGDDTDDRTPTDTPPTDTAPTGDTGADGPTADTGGVEELSASASLHETYGTLVRVRWRQPTAGAAHVEYSFDAGAWISSPERDLGPGAHEQLLVGIPYDATVTWRVVVGDERTPDATLAVASRPADLPVADVQGDPTRWDPDSPYVLVSLTDGEFLGDRWWLVILDREGRVVWARRSPDPEAYLHPRVAHDRRALLIDRNTYWGSFPYDGGASSKVERSLLDGTVLETWDTPGLHHDFTDLPDGSIVWASYEPPYIDERLMRIHPDGTVEEVFDCMAWLATQPVSPNLWCGSNTVTWDAVDGTLWWSMFSFMTILEIDPDDGSVLATWGNLPGSWDFEPSSRDGFWYQHGGYLTPSGTLLTSTWQAPFGVETVVREYAIDRVQRKLTLVWEFGEGDGVWEEPFQQMGDALRLPNGNTLHNTGTVPRLREAMPDGSVVWDVTWPADAVTAIGRSEPIEDLWSLLPDAP